MSFSQVYTPDELERAVAAAAAAGRATVLVVYRDRCRRTVAMLRELAREFVGRVDFYTADARDVDDPDGDYPAVWGYDQSRYASEEPLDLRSRDALRAGITALL